MWESCILSTSLHLYSFYLAHRHLVSQCDSEGPAHNCLVPLRHCLPSPGGPLKYSLEGHDFAVFGCSLTNDRKYVVSVSARLISWDLATSEVM